MIKWKSNSGSYKLLKALLIIGLPFLLLFASFSYWMFNENYFESQFEENDVYVQFGFDKYLVLNENSKLLSYLKSGDGLIDSAFYTPDEKAHLDDVRILIQTFLHFGIAFSVLWFVGLVVCRKNITSIFYKGGLLSLLLFVILAVLLVFFSSAFIKFHEIFFEPGTWTFDPSVSNLKAMFPDEFFYNITEKIFVSFGFLALVSVSSKVLLYLTYRHLGRRIARH